MLADNRSCRVGLLKASRRISSNSLHRTTTRVHHKDHQDHQEDTTEPLDKAILVATTPGRLRTWAIVVVETADIAMGNISVTSVLGQARA